MTERPPGTEPSDALDRQRDGRGPTRSPVRVSLIGSSLDATAARIVVGPGSDSGHPTIDGRPVTASLRRLDGVRARLEISPGHGPAATILLLPPTPTAARSGVVRREVVADGWRFVVEVEPEARAALRERASRGATAHARTGPSDVRAVIPGRIVSVEVVPGDGVVAGQRVMIIEAMKMQNELRVPRDGTVSRIVVGAGQTIDVGDLLLVLE